ncbi:hypothetical protein [Robiginitalea aurantiaca]|uniref:Uncharacterized protein n=1 Tax=Robiginitalea aurantiaca TaxID=3056915 RepID=A0ABT7WBF4_9FLAO|nr:hypothetical protein [Robiginitalea aurantiaca]MDM9630237.1 hypothetical protein [Robiginitalea aurantiaca]
MKNRVVKTEKNILSDYFTKESTKTFLHEMDIALRSLSYGEVLRVVLNYNILKLVEVKEFLSAYAEMLRSWQKPYEGTIIVGEIITRASKCIACVYGKDMTVYEFQYKHSRAKEPYNYIVYGYNFGMLYDIQDGILNDLRICNAFLSKSEMQNLSK